MTSGELGVVPDESGAGQEVSHDLLLEVGVEEIPARYLPGAVEELGTRARQAFFESNLVFGDVETFGTPRRLVLYVRDVAPVTRPKEVRVRGPSKQAAFDESGAPTRALLGFCRSQGVSPDQIVVEKDRSGEYVYAVKSIPGQPVARALRDLLPDVVLGLGCPRPLRWNGYRFFRPVRWVVCLYGSDVVELEIAGVCAGRTTWGHRTLHPQSREIQCSGDYFAVARDMGVVPGIVERRKIIAEGAASVASRVGGRPVLDEELLTEVACLTEHPAPFLGGFEARFLTLPAEVLSTVMKHHQRYFPVEDSNGNLMPFFIGVRDGDALRGMETVRQGNEWVLKARLEDASFFYREDMKTPLGERLESLKGMYFLGGAGTIYDKVARMEEIVESLAAETGVTGEELERARLACRLSKCDLATSMVRELPELEGIMGGHYASSQGYPRDVCRAISCQYLPRTAQDPLPDPGIASLVALADKMDTLAVAFLLGISPSGSQDPYGLRRLAYGVIATVVGRGLRLDLTRTLQHCVEVCEASVPATARRKTGDALHELLAFMSSRFESYLLDRGFRVEVVRTVADGALGDPASAFQKAEALSAFLRRPGFGDLVVAYRRCSVLARNSRGDSPVPDLLVEPAEKALYGEAERKELDARRLMEEGDFPGYLELLSTLRPAVDRCLDEVLIMTDDEKLRENRLALLRKVANMFSRYGDFAHVLPLETQVPAAEDEPRRADGQRAG